MFRLTVIRMPRVVCSFSWYFQTQRPLKLSLPSRPGALANRSRWVPFPWPSSLSPCQCANLQPATPLFRPALPASNSRVWRCQQHALLKTNQLQSPIKHREVMTSSPFQPITTSVVPSLIPEPGTPPCLPDDPLRHEQMEKKRSKQGSGLIWAHRTEKTICMPTLCYSTWDTVGGNMKVCSLWIKQCRYLNTLNDMQRWTAGVQWSSTSFN